MPVWPYAPAAVATRGCLQAPLFALLRCVAPSMVSGLERLEAIAPPALFVANHESHLDTPVLLAALPPAWRRRVAVAAARDYFFAQPAIGAAVGLTFGAFPIERTDWVRPTLKNCDWLKRHGWSILYYPEGTRSTTGELGRFKNGVGMLAVQLGLPVVPVRTAGLFGVLPKGRWLPRPGRASVRFGEPFTVDPELDPRATTAAITRAVRAL